METGFMGAPALKFQLIMDRPNYKTQTVSPFITCALRTRPRKPLWRKKRISTEAIQAIQALKLAKSSTSRLDQVFSTKLSRLLKTDLLDTLTILQEQNELDLALKVFEFVRKEVWYKPDITLYYDLIEMMGKNKLIEMAEEFFSRIEEEEGLKPDTRAFTEMIGAYFGVEMIDKAMETYQRMKASGCAPDKLTFAILIRELEEAGRPELVETVKKECEQYIKDAEEFLEEFERKMSAKGRVADLV
ncbi:hypothetical protein Tsubulata_048452 [Turnera subulata]|uniref:Pentacotripeptide-repeat region of PRORP domain-containing protein n=1 Tax=Turnera subulata TaxID=218843 RepID=A0A9Q0F595_9ROSI|nr:hypothetical protein Tsubulata_048452 [Turnera subulata]